MKCLRCGSLDAHEINISLNFTECAPGVSEAEYTGTTDYGNCSKGFGTECPTCMEVTIEADYMHTVSNYLANAGLHMHLMAAG